MREYLFRGNLPVQTVTATELFGTMPKKQFSSLSMITSARI